MRPRLALFHNAIAVEHPIIKACFPFLPILLRSEIVNFETIEFDVPETMSIMETLMHPSRWGVPQYVAFSISATQIALLFVPGIPQWWYLFSFLFWRFAYNAGLGFLLHVQSNSLAISRFYSSLASQFPQLDRWFGKVMGPSYDADEYPMAFRSWLAYRWLVDVILGNDFVAYTVLTFVSFEFPASVGVLEVAQYILGISLCIFNLWAKWDAHRVLGDYAWYWGDFFFLVDKNLVFDGIFQMFPHPMYTVGYSFFYGVSLITRSYRMLFVSLFAHLFQLAFLAFVENPHIDKTYSSMVEKDEEKSRTHGDTPIILFRFNPLESADMLLLVLIAYNVLLYVLDLPMFVYVAHFVCWRLFHDGFLGGILWFLSNRPGRVSLEFSSWKRIYNASLTMNYVSFFIAAYKFYWFPPDWDFSSYLAKQLIGLCLVALNIWSSWSTYETLGDFGWFYGDFFFTDNVPHRLRYQGIYRFVNNPETVMGFAGYYGLAILSHSLVVFLLAVFAHACQIAFVRYVEQPHMLKLYGSEEVREKSGFEEALSANREKLLLNWEETKARLRLHGIDVDKVKAPLDEIEQAIRQNTSKVIRKMEAVGLSPLGKKTD